MTLTRPLDNYRRKPEDNRPKSKPDLVDVPTESTGTVAMRPKYWCEMCNQDVVLFGGKYSHAAPKEYTCGTTPIPMLAVD